METNGQTREPGGAARGELPPVPLADLERAAAIARGVRGGGPGDRRATREQLLAAFGEPEPSPRALRRIEAALARAGVTTRPALEDAVEGFPVALELGAAPRGPAARTVLMVAGALAALVLLVALGRAVGGDEEPGVTLPADTVTTVTVPATTVTTPTATDTTAAEPETVSLTLIPTDPGFACVIDEQRHVLFRGTLSRRVTVEGGRLRALVTAPAVAVAHGRRQKLPGRRIVVVGSTRLKVLLDGPAYCEKG